MINNVLIVDDNQEILITLKEGLEKYEDSFSVILAGGGEAAVKLLKKGDISLVVTDLKMPKMDGLALLAHIMEHYPDIPVIVITGYGTPKMERFAKKSGAVDYIEKPFMSEDLARKILEALRKRSEGGTLHGVSSGMFLQLIEMEEKTCTIRVAQKDTGRQGVLFFGKGELVEARSGGITGVKAAYRIFSWDEVNISIQNSCPVNTRKITEDLQGILLEAMRLKDESGDEEHPEEIEVEEILDNEPQAAARIENLVDSESIKALIVDALGDRCGIEDIYRDNSHDNFIAMANQVGAVLYAGVLKVGYLDFGRTNDLILMPGDQTHILSVNNKCPRDKVMPILSKG